jgi:SOS-response transcriptional repressor LexA
MDTLAKRVREQRKALGMTQAQLAEASGLQQSDISKIENGKVQSTTAVVELARALQKPPEWLRFAGDVDQYIDATYNVAPYKPRARVPLISEVRAGMLSDIEDNFHPGEADEWVEADTSTPTKSAFALKVTGESMLNPAGEPSFPEGTIIIVDPGRHAGPNNYVVAKDVVTQRATFKKLVTDGGRWFLRPLNPAYPTQEIDDPCIRVIGRVIEYKRSGKL